VTEGDLIRPAATGDERAFLTIWNRHRDAIYRFACWMLGKPAAAENVTQAAFQALLERPEVFDPNTASLRTFLIAIARNLSHKQLRRIRPQEDLDTDAESADTGPFDRLLIIDRDEALHAAVAQLRALGDTIHSWSEEIGRMWRFTRSNGITEGFHNKMENYRQRVRVLCA
jgi:RNA polymerase sigma factor (sigma-70 family)